MHKMSQKTLERMMVVAIGEVKKLCTSSNPTEEEIETLEKNLITLILRKRHQRSFTFTVKDRPIQELEIAFEQSLNKMPVFNPRTFIQIILDFDEQKVLIKENSIALAQTLYENKLPQTA